MRCKFKNRANYENNFVGIHLRKLDVCFGLLKGVNILLLSFILQVLI